MNYVHLLTETGGTIGYVLLAISILSGALVVVLLPALMFQTYFARRYPRDFLATVAPNSLPMATLREVPKISSALGLLGTVVGMIGAFGAMKGRPEMSVLSGYLSKAMVTTWAGLGIAVVDQVAYFLLKRCTRGAVAEAAQRVGKRPSDDVGRALAGLAQYGAQQGESLAQVLKELRVQTESLGGLRTALSSLVQQLDETRRIPQVIPEGNAENTTPVATTGHSGTVVTEMASPNGGGERWYMKLTGGTLTHILVVSNGRRELISPDEACARLEIPPGYANRFARGLGEWPVRYLVGEDADLVLDIIDRSHRSNSTQPIAARRGRRNAN